MAKQKCTCSVNADSNVSFGVNDDGSVCTKCSDRCVDCSNRFWNNDMISLGKSGKHICKTCF